MCNFLTFYGSASVFQRQKSAIEIQQFHYAAIAVKWQKGMPRFFSNANILDQPLFPDCKITLQRRLSYVLRGIHIEVLHRKRVYKL